MTNLQISQHIIRRHIARVTNASLVAPTICQRHSLHRQLIELLSSFFSMLS